MRAWRAPRSGSHSNQFSPLEAEASATEPRDPGTDRPSSPNESRYLLATRRHR